VSWKITDVMTNGNKCNSSIEIGAATNSESTGRFIRKETLRKIKSIGGHVGLLITLMLYTAIGGLVSLEKTLVRNALLKMLAHVFAILVLFV